MAANLTEKERTFLTLKYGEKYRTQIIEAWHDDGGVGFTETERRIIIEWLQRMAGIRKDKK